MVSINDDTHFIAKSGTSFATPLVAGNFHYYSIVKFSLGVVALIKSAHPDWTPRQILHALTSTASQADSPDNDCGWGIIDAMKAINANVSNIGLKN